MTGLSVFHPAGALAAAVTAALLLAAAPAAAQTAPRQAWAHKDHRVELLAQDQAPQVAPADYLAIQQAFARFGIAYDEGRGEVLASLFTDDAVVEVADGQGKPFERSVGRDAVVRQMAAAFAAQADQRRHLISNVLVERFAPTEAKALAYGLVTVAADGLYVGASVIYSATLRRAPNGPWRFSALFIGIDSYVGKKPKVTAE